MKVEDDKYYNMFQEEKQHNHITENQRNTHEQTFILKEIYKKTNFSVGVFCHMSVSQVKEQEIREQQKDMFN